MAQLIYDKTDEWDNRVHSPEDFAPPARPVGDAERDHEAMCRGKVAANDCVVLNQKDKDYGASWRKRGGVGAFMMLARKWDRLENIMKESHAKEGIGSAHQYDLFEQLEFNYGDVLDDLRDLRRYLLLAEGYLVATGRVRIDKP